MYSRAGFLTSIKGEGVTPIGAWIKVTESDARAGRILEWMSENETMKTGLAQSDLLEASAHYFYGTALDDLDLYSPQVRQLIHFVDDELLPNGEREEKIFALQNAAWWLTLFAAEDAGRKFRREQATAKEAS